MIYLESHVNKDGLKDQLMEYMGMVSRENGGEVWYMDRMRKQGLQITKLKKSKESIWEQEKKREEYEYLDRGIGRIMSEAGREQERNLIIPSYGRWSGRYTWYWKTDCKSS